MSPQPAKGRTLCIDWDDTLVSYKRFGDLENPGTWLDGAPEALRALLKSGRQVVIHSCRANWDQGRETIYTKLLEAGLERWIRSGDLDIWLGEGKPLGLVYVDDRGFRFPGSWTDLVPELKALTR